MNRIKIYSQLLAAAGLVFTSSAYGALVVTDGSANVITHDADFPGVYQVGTPGAFERSLVEPDNFGRSIFNATPEWTYFPESVAIRGQFSNPGGRGANTSSFFGPDLNLDSDTIDQESIPRGPRVFSTPGAPVSGAAMKLADDADFANSHFYLQIQNATGLPVNQWVISADLFADEPDTSGFSVIAFQYAADNGNDPDAMAFTDFATPEPLISQTAGLVSLGNYGETINAPVAPGGFLVLAISDSAGSTSGSTVFVDNISIRAIPVPEPTSLLLCGLAGLAMCGRARRV